MEILKEEKTFFPLKGWYKNEDYQKAKTPAIREWQIHKGLSEKVIKSKLEKGHWLGLALKNTTVVDLDSIQIPRTGEVVQEGHDVGALVVEALRQKGYSFHAIHTPNGYQLIFNHTEGIRNNVKQVTPLGAVADYRIKDKGYIVYPTENTENRYFVHRSDKPLSDVPDFLMPMKRHHAVKQFTPLYPIQEGAQNDTIHQWLSEVHNFKDPEQVREIGHLIGDYLCEPPYDSPDMLNRTIDSVLGQPKRDTAAPAALRAEDEFGIIPGGQLAGAELKRALAQKRHAVLLEMENAWEEQGGKGRKPSVISTITCARVLQEFVKFTLFDLEENTKLAMYLPDEGIYTQNTTLIHRVISWFEPTHNKYKAEEVIFHIKNMADVQEKTDVRHLIPVDNGVFNLKTKRLEDFTPDFVFTTKVSTKYVQNPEPPIIEGWDVDSWMNDIACGDREVVRLLWQVVNDALNGNYTRKKAIFLVGDGNNGKGTFQELLANVIGFKNVASLKVNEFDERFRLSVLEGKTAVIGDDVPVSVYVDDSSNFKSVITGDTVSVEFKGQPIYNTAFKCTVIQSTNDLPRFRDKTGGMTRRMIIVPFKADFNGHRENFDIKEDFIKRPEVLEYVLNKAVHLDFEKFDVPKVSLAAMEDFKQDIDPVYEFKVTVFDPWNIPEVPKNLVYAYYRQFCDENGYKYLSVRKFHNEFRKHLGDDWRSDTVAKVSEDRLNKYLGDIQENRYIDFNYPDPRKAYKTYRVDYLDII